MTEITSDLTVLKDISTFPDQVLLLFLMLSLISDNIIPKNISAQPMMFIAVSLSFVKINENIIANTGSMENIIAMRTGGVYRPDIACTPNASDVPNIAVYIAAISDEAEKEAVRFSKIADNIQQPIAAKAI
jgi:hypothetical protein